MSKLIISKRENGSRRVQTEIIGKSMTQQSYKGQTNINKIMKKYEQTGLIDHLAQGGSYGDFTQVSDYHSAMSQIKNAEEAFMTLPASLRKHFGNDPQALIEFLSDPNNKEEAERLGLIEKSLQGNEEIPPIGENTTDPKVETKTGNAASNEGDPK